MKQNTVRAAGPKIHEYLGRRRRTLLDMHIPDWEPTFLSNFDPEAVARCYELAELNAAMLYCKSHTGLCYWPTNVGRSHPALTGREILAELLEQLHRRDILACAYTSVAWDFAAAESHPEWQIAPSLIGENGEPVPSWRKRHKILCLNKKEYLEYEKAQISDLMARYPFDALFLDMMFWSAICICEDCRLRWADEDGREFPKSLDWMSPVWSSFQAARERWADEFAQELLAHARSIVDIPVYQNFAPTLFGWTSGKPLHAFRNDTFIGGDLYGGPEEQLFVCKLMNALSSHHPAEYMTCRSPSASDQVTIRSEDLLALHAYAATTLSCATLITDPVNPDGSIESAVYEQLGRLNRRLAPYEPFSGGVHLEDIAVYFSSAACVDLSCERVPLEKVHAWPTVPKPHLTAAVGACRVLQQMHLAAGVATYRDLNDLSRYRVLVVPELLRITAHEMEAFRNYVAAGGLLYVSGRTSLLTVEGDRGGDFALADLLGVHYEGSEDGHELFLQPCSPALAEAAAPQRYLAWRSHTESDPTLREVPRLSTDFDGIALATLALPYGYPAEGTRNDRSWANMYSNPPWDGTSHPTIVERQVGRGTVIYSVVPLEMSPDGAAGRLFRCLIGRLLGDRWRLRGEAHPTVWLEAFHQPDQRRYIVNALTYQCELPPLSATVEFTLVLASDEEVTGVSLAPEGTPIPYEASAGRVSVSGVVHPYAMYVVNYAATETTP